MKKIPYEINDFEKLIEEGYYYVDKTESIKEIEKEISNPIIMLLRPSRFGKTLFLSVLENYYDILKKDKFKQLFSGTYIGKKPTRKHNKYYILKIDFSHLNTESEDKIMLSHKSEVKKSIESFIEKYNIELTINEEQSPEEMLDSLFTAFKKQKRRKQICILIDEYDKFANELLGINIKQFDILRSKIEKISKLYKTIQDGTETVVGKVFITGKVPIKMDGLENAEDITLAPGAVEILGFRRHEIMELMEKQNISNEQQEILIETMRDYYGGYKFCEDMLIIMYNPDMCLYLLDNFIKNGKLPENIINEKTKKEYKKIEKLMEEYEHVGKDAQIRILFEKGAGLTPIKKTIDLEKPFQTLEVELTMFYLGYLTVGEKLIELPELIIPNETIRTLCK